LASFKSAVSNPSVQPVDRGEEIAGLFDPTLIAPQAAAAGGSAQFQ
jgi:hypothetical protein